MLDIYALARRILQLIDTVPGAYWVHSWACDQAYGMWQSYTLSIICSNLCSSSYTSRQIHQDSGQYVLPKNILAFSWFSFHPLIRSG